jgi:hypothetical protein
MSLIYGIAPLCTIVILRELLILYDEYIYIPNLLNDYHKRNDNKFKIFALSKRLIRLNNELLDRKATITAVARFL